MLFWYHKKNTHAIIFFIEIRILIESKYNIQSKQHEQTTKTKTKTKMAAHKHTKTKAKEQASD